ncbi:MAG: sigma-70 family RNA polymerase sigma factor [Planctomycetes bacterium]|nr:sigma-70 family RNA polymerase sigma factor [Planctomycetota bacterium]
MGVEPNGGDDAGDGADGQDAVLVARARDDRAALQGSFRALYQRHGGRVYRFLRAQTGSDERAKDCLQETFLRLYRALDRYDPARPFAPWLLGIARNVAQDLLRREQVRATDPLPAELPGAAAQPVPAAVEQREVTTLVRAAVGNLPEREREVFLLRQVEGLTFVEVADALGCSVRTAKYRMRAAVDNLASELRQRGVVEGLA